MFNYGNYQLYIGNNHHNGCYRQIETMLQSDRKILQNNEIIINCS